MTDVTPTDAQQQRAKWDLLLLEHCGRLHLGHQLHCRGEGCACVNREFLDARRAEDRAYLNSRLATLKTKLIGWVVGTVGLATMINHWWR